MRRRGQPRFTTHSEYTVWVAGLLYADAPRRAEILAEAVALFRRDVRLHPQAEALRGAGRALRALGEDIERALGPQEPEA